MKILKFILSFLYGLWLLGALGVMQLLCWVWVPIHWFSKLGSRTLTAVLKFMFPTFFTPEPESAWDRANRTWDKLESQLLEKDKARVKYALFEAAKMEDDDHYRQLATGGYTPGNGSIYTPGNGSINPIDGLPSELCLGPMSDPCELGWAKIEASARKGGVS